MDLRRVQCRGWLRRGRCSHGTPALRGKRSCLLQRTGAVEHLVQRHEELPPVAEAASRVWTTSLANCATGACAGPVCRRMKMQRGSLQPLWLMRMGKTWIGAGLVLARAGLVLDGCSRAFAHCPPRRAVCIGLYRCAGTGACVHAVCRGVARGVGLTRWTWLVPQSR